MALDPEFKAKWVAALRSGEYQQGRLHLHPSKDTYCCLAVACIVDGIEPPTMNSGGSTDRSYAHLQERNINVTTFFNLNDADERSFAEIADYIETNL